MKGCCLKYPYSGETDVFFSLPFSDLVATIVVSIFSSGNVIYFAKEILPDLLIASDTELPVVLFTGTKIIKMTASKAKSVPKPNKKLQTTDSRTK